MPPQCLVVLSISPSLWCGLLFGKFSCVAVLRWCFSGMKFDPIVPKTKLEETRKQRHRAIKDDQLVHVVGPLWKRFRSEGPGHLVHMAVSFALARLPPPAATL
jgi:hypothetical protein